MAKNIWMITTILLLVIGSGWFVFNNSKSTNNGNSVNNGEYQKVVIGMKNYNYYPNDVKVKAGTTVRLYLDNSVRGCYRSLVINEFGIRKNLQSASDYVEFTPTQKGTYPFSCSMGMGTGRIIVE
ncbi:MAG: cupredoxin domain-containing protein [Nanoarchaeota archaeon]|nr:cupredoxin domain-containing protein [Nanoarchaeota archaeon]